ncbi:MAG: TldD/PmbA family protein [Pseudomonadota bacterium]
MITALSFSLLLSTAWAEEPPDDPVLAALGAEVERAMAALGARDVPPYFLAAELSEARGVSMSAEEGALQGYSPQHQRVIDVDLRIGGPDFDSSHATRAGQGGRGGMHGRPVPLGEDAPLIQRALWGEIEARYADAQQRWGKVESDRQVLVAESPAPDLAPADPVQALLPELPFELDYPAWEQRLREASAVLAESEVVQDGSVGLRAQAVTRWLATSEGTRLRDAERSYSVRVHVDTVADDGAALELGRTFNARDPAGLPDTAALVAATAELEALLAALRQAPEQEPYTGPAVLSDQAAGVFFHEILGHRLEGHRLKQVDDAQTLRDMVGQPILPAFLSLVDDPTLPRLVDTDLNGFYAYDAEGVPAQRTVLVDHGVLQGFLESRSPSREGVASNGHGRHQPGLDPVARQGNLIVEADASVSDAELRAELIALAKAQGLEYGLRIEQIEGGVTFTGRRQPNAFKVDVLVAWRVFVDGRPDQLVRGVDMIGTPLVTLSRIVRVGELHQVFNGICGAESGGVPVSAVSPAMLISQVETQRKTKEQTVPPLLPPPGTAGGRP